MLMEDTITNCLIVGNNINCLIIRDMIIKDGDNIPSWLLVEVLIRLPLKSIFRCKLVSKQWLSIILDPYCVRLYCSRAQQHRRWAIFGRFMFVNESETPHFLDYDDSSSKHASCFYPFPVHWRQHNTILMHWVYGVSNGLVLYTFSKDEYFNKTTIFRICNPATGQWLALPPYDDDKDRFCTGFVANVEDGVLLSFIVVRMYESCGQTVKFTKCQVYFSEIGEWKMYNVHIDGIIPIKIMFTWENHRSTTVLNGIIYWILRANVLLAYDPSKSPDQARTIALPPEPTYNSPIDDTDLCSAYQGQLRYFRASYLPRTLSPIYIISSFDIWVMNKAEEWCLQHRVSPVDIIQPDFISRAHRRLFPMSFHPFDSDVVFLSFSRIVLSYNIKTRKLQVEEDFTHDPRGSLGGYAQFMLVLPPWPISISLEETARRGLINDYKLN